MPQTHASQAVQHMMTFDVEEYFHAEAFRQVIGPNRWHEWPSRLDGQVDALLALLAEADVRSTCFILGAVARTHTEAIHRIARAGHEIACHGNSHEMIARLGPEGFRQDTQSAKEFLEDQIGQEVLGYRAATFGLMRSTAWAIDILADLGFAYDSSVQPVRHDRYGVPDAPPHAHLAVGPGGGEILEIPPMTRKLGRRNFPVGGGGFFRLFPLVLFDRTLRQWARRGEAGMFYLHPWELDPGQPVVEVSRMSRFRHRVNLARTGSKLHKLMSRHAFGPVREALPALRARATERFRYAPE